MRVRVKTLLFVCLILYSSLFNFSYNSYARENQTSLVRLIDVSPYLKSIDVYIDGERVAKNIPFKGKVHYIKLSAGEHKFDIVPSKFDQVNKATITKKIKFVEGTPYTLAIVGEQNRVDLLCIKDLVEIPKGEASLRLAHLYPGGSKIQVAIQGGRRLIHGGTFKQVTNYINLEPALYDLEVRTSTNQRILDLSDIHLQAHTLYTLFVFERNGKIDALLYEDAGFIPSAQKQTE